MAGVAFHKLSPRMLKAFFDHHRWLATKGRAGAQLDGARGDFVAYDLDGIDLSFANLVGAHLTFSTLRGARLVGANLEGAYLLSTTLDDTDFTGANLKGACVSRDSCLTATFNCADLAGMRWTTEHIDLATPTSAHVSAYRAFLEDVPHLRDQWERHGSIYRWFSRFGSPTLSAIPAGALLSTGFEGSSSRTAAATDHTPSL
jgi:hypothetical protein